MLQARVPPPALEIVKVAGSSNEVVAWQGAVNGIVVGVTESTGAPPPGGGGGGGGGVVGTSTVTLMLWGLLSALDASMRITPLCVLPHSRRPALIVTEISSVMVPTFPVCGEGWIQGKPVVADQGTLRPDTEIPIFWAGGFSPHAGAEKVNAAGEMTSSVWGSCLLPQPAETSRRSRNNRRSGIY